ncbi:MAG: ABC transporter substrate-binding protein [Chloroflexota bacterium]
MTWNRRQFLRGSLLAVANVAILAACGQQQPAAKPAESKPAESKPAAPAATSAPAKPAAAASPAAAAASPAAGASPAAAAKPPETKPVADAKPVSRTPAGELKIGLPAKLTTLDPQGAQSVDGVTHTAMQHVFDTLIGRDPASGDLMPKLATSWEAPDATTWVFKLRSGVKFHDGSDFTANDVKASLERIIAQKGPVAPLFAAVETIETPDPMTVRLKMKNPVGTIPASVTLLTVGPAAAINNDGFFNKPIGTGPFKFVSWRADADLRLEANDQYWGGPPAAKTLVMKHIPEIAARMTSLETGEIDFTWRIPPDQIPGLKSNSELKIDTTPSYQYYFMWMNSSRDVFADKRIRQAMIYALDVKTMANDLLPGIGQPATAPIPPTVFGYAPQTPYAYDPAKAKQLLAEAGKPNGFETSFIWYSGAGPQDRELGQAMVAYWDAVGIKVKVAEQERATWLDNLIKLNWDMDFQTNAVTTGDADFTLGRLYHSRANRNGYKNEALDKILDEAVAATDQNKRKELYAQANKIIWDDAVGIFPFDLLETFAARKTVEGFTPTPSAFLTFYNAKVK